MEQPCGGTPELIRVNLKYWEWESMPAREKLSKPSVKHLCNVLFEHEAHQYRFAQLLTHFKERKTLRLRDLPEDQLPKATWHRYLTYAEHLGIVKKEHGVYELTNRFSNPLKNLADFYQRWYKEAEKEDLTTLYPLQKLKENQKQQTEQAAASKEALEASQTQPKNETN